MDEFFYGIEHDIALAIEMTYDGDMHHGCLSVDTDLEGDDFSVSTAASFTDRSAFDTFHHNNIFDDVTQRLVTQGIIDNCNQYNIITTADIEEAMKPVKPKLTKASRIDYESKRPRLIDRSIEAIPKLLIHSFPIYIDLNLIAEESISCHSQRQTRDNQNRSIL